MSENDFSLAELRDSIASKYKPATIDIGEGRTIKLLQIARLPDESQEKLILMQGEFKGLQDAGRKLNGAAADVSPEDVAEWVGTLDYDPTPEQVDEFKQTKASAGVTHEDVKRFKGQTVDLLERMLRLVAQSEDDADSLIDACGHDELLLMEVFTRYSKRTKLGEASASQSSSGTTAGPSSTTSENTSGSTSDE